MRPYSGPGLWDFAVISWLCQGHARALLSQRDVMRRATLRGQVVRESRVNEFHGVSFRLKSNLRVLGFPDIRNQVESIGAALRSGNPASELEPELQALETALLGACQQLRESL